MALGRNKNELENTLNGIKQILVMFKMGMWMFCDGGTGV